MAQVHTSCVAERWVRCRSCAGHGSAVAHAPARPGLRPTPQASSKAAVPDGHAGIVHERAGLASFPRASKRRVRHRQPPTGVKHTRLLLPQNRPRSTLDIETGKMAGGGCRDHLASHRMKSALPVQACHYLPLRACFLTIHLLGAMPWCSQKPTASSASQAPPRAYQRGQAYGPNLFEGGYFQASRWAAT